MQHLPDGYHPGQIHDQVADGRDDSAIDKWARPMTNAGVVGAQAYGQLAAEDFQAAHHAGAQAMIKGYGGKAGQVVVGKGPHPMVNATAVQLASCAQQCGRPAAECFRSCCRTCERTAAAQHGPTCETAHAQAMHTRIRK